MLSRSTKIRRVTPYPVIFCEQVLSAQDFGHAPTISKARKLLKQNILAEAIKKNVSDIYIYPSPYHMRDFFPAGLRVPACFFEPNTRAKILSTFFSWR